MASKEGMQLTVAKQRHLAVTLKRGRYGFPSIKRHVAYQRLSDEISNLQKLFGDFGYELSIKLPHGVKPAEPVDGWGGCR